VSEQAAASVTGASAHLCCDEMSAPEGPIVIAFDGSAAARQAVTDAAWFVQPRRALVLTVWDGAVGYAMVAPSPDVMMAPAVDPAAVLDMDDQLGARAERVAGEGAELARSLGLDAQPLALPAGGGVATTILDVAREHDAVAIVVGSRGLNGLRARLEGSTSKDVLKRAPCPVLIVHEHGEHA
jgi:nucleotide-binding universal stress UspA family protein